ncbi:hypothetical protein B0H14DRAFT_2573851 [Mycena olivaceomarginata]|nr:hypothetical protein B0H14DRAFT_2573851 [Mycena olivaceomarginata]
MNDAGDHSTPSIYLLNDITFPSPRAQQMMPLISLRWQHIGPYTHSLFNSTGLWYAVAGFPPSSLLLTYFLDFTRCDLSNSNSRTPAGQPVSFTLKCPAEVYYNQSFTLKCPAEFIFVY